MKKIYCNEYTDELFDTEEKAAESERKYLEAKAVKEKAEAERKAALEKKNSERAARAKEVEDKRKAYIDARNEYQKALSNFCKDYGAYHMSVKDVNPLSLIDTFFDLI